MKLLRRTSIINLLLTKRRKQYSCATFSDRKTEIESQTESERKIPKAKYINEETLAKRYLKMCFTTETVQPLSVMEVDDKLSSLWNELVTMCQIVD